MEKNELLQRTKDRLESFRSTRERKTQPLPQDIKMALKKLVKVFPSRKICGHLNLSYSLLPKLSKKRSGLRPRQKNKTHPPINFLEIPNPVKEFSRPILELELPSGGKVRVFA